VDENSNTGTRIPGIRLIPKCFSDTDKSNPTAPRRAIQMMVLDFGWYTSGDNARFDDTPTDTRSVKLFKLAPRYTFRIHPMLDIGAGAGMYRFSGDGFNAFTRATLTPLQMSFFPLGWLEKSTGSYKWAHVIRVEHSQTFVTKGINAVADFNSASTYSKNGEFVASIGIGIDLGSVFLR
jgi:hypothetical protein